MITGERPKLKPLLEQIITKQKEQVPIEKSVDSETEEFKKDEIKEETKIEWINKDIMTRELSIVLDIETAFNLSQTLHKIT